MWRKVTEILVLVSVLFCIGLVKQATAQTVDFGGSTFTPLFLDQGFMNRSVDLDLPSINLRVQFTETDIPAPGVLTIITQKINSESDSEGLGSDVSLFWTTNSASSPETAKVTISNEQCGQNEEMQCAIQETYQGEITIHQSDSSTSTSATANVHINATIRLVKVKKSDVGKSEVGYMTEGDASWYAYKNCDCAASPDFAKGSYVKVTSLDDESKTVIVRINDYGPERDIFPNRVIDLDKVAFAKLASLGAGVIKVKVEPAEAPAKTIVSQPIMEEVKEPEPIWEL